MREIDKALQTYEERFGERFPTEAMGLASAEEVLAEIQRCLEVGEAGGASPLCPGRRRDTGGCSIARRAATDDTRRSRYRRMLRKSTSV